MTSARKRVSDAKARYDRERELVDEEQYLFRGAVIANGIEEREITKRMIAAARPRALGKKPKNGSFGWCENEADRFK
jgi:hypothetical protein